MKALSVATDPAFEGAALRILKEHGTAADALIGGFFAAAGARPGVLLGPAQMLIAGPGVGPRAFDGRARQPGRGAPRPRGFAEQDAVPDSARVAAPAAITMLALAHAHDGALSMSRLAARGVEEARARGAKGRASVLSRIGSGGALALRDPAILRPLLAAASRVEGGLLTEEDLASVRPESAPPEAVGMRGTPRGGRGLWLSPWAFAEPPQRRQEVAVAADARGVLAVLSFSPDDQGIAIPELELCAPPDACVVRRGVPRVRPGAPLPCPAPVAVGFEGAHPLFALGVFASLPLDAAVVADRWRDPMATAADVLRAASDSTGAARAVGVVRITGRDKVEPVLLDAAARKTDDSE